MSNSRRNNRSRNANFDSMQFNFFVEPAAVSNVAPQPNFFIDVPNGFHPNGNPNITLFTTRPINEIRDYVENQQSPQPIIIKEEYDISTDEFSTISDDVEHFYAQFGLK